MSPLSHLARLTFHASVLMAMAGCGGSIDAPSSEDGEAVVAAKPFTLQTIFDEALTKPHEVQHFKFSLPHGKVKFQIAMGAENNGGPAFIPHVVITELATKQVRFEGTADVSGTLNDQSELTAAGAYDLSVSATDAHTGKYTLQLIADLPCTDLHNPTRECPAPLKCKQLKDDWSWGAPGKTKCMP